MDVLIRRSGGADAIESSRDQLSWSVVNFTCTIFEDHPHQILRHNNFIQPRNVWVDKLSVVMDFAGQIGVGSIRRLQHNLGGTISQDRQVTSAKTDTHLGAIGELVGGQIHLAKGSFANEAAERVIADRLKIVAREFTVEVETLAVSKAASRKGRVKQRASQLTPRAPGRNWQATRHRSVSHTRTSQSSTPAPAPSLSSSSRAA